MFFFKLLNNINNNNKQTNIFKVVIDVTLHCGCRHDSIAAAHSYCLSIDSKTNSYFHEPAAAATYIHYCYIFSIFSGAFLF